MVFNIFKKKPKEETKQEVKDAIGKEGTVLHPSKRIGVSALSLPHISEKAGMLQAQNQYVFRVTPRATKYGVKESVEEQYGVLVKKVAMIQVPSKSIRVGKTVGQKQGYKKAVVTLQEGHKIETVSS